MDMKTAEKFSSHWIISQLKESDDADKRLLAYEVVISDTVDDFIHSNDQSKEQLFLEAAKEIVGLKELRYDTYPQICDALIILSILQCIDSVDVGLRNQRSIPIVDWYTDWFDKLFFNLHQCWVLLLTKPNPSELKSILKTVKWLREIQPNYEESYLNRNGRTGALNVMGIYFLAKCTELVARYLLESELDWKELNSMFETSRKLFTLSREYNLDDMVMWLHAATSVLVKPMKPPNKVPKPNLGNIVDQMRPVFEDKKPS